MRRLLWSKLIFRLNRVGRFIFYHLILFLSNIFCYWCLTSWFHAFSAFYFNVTFDGRLLDLFFYFFFNILANYCWYFFFFLNNSLLLFVLSFNFLLFYCFLCWKWFWWMYFFLNLLLLNFSFFGSLWSFLNWNSYVLFLIFQKWFCFYWFRWF